MWCNEKTIYVQVYWVAKVMMILYQPRGLTTSTHQVVPTLWAVVRRAESGSTRALPLKALVLRAASPQTQTCVECVLVSFIQTRANSFLITKIIRLSNIFKLVNT